MLAGGAFAGSCQVEKGNLSEEWGGGVVRLTCVNDEIVDVSRATAG